MREKKKMSGENNLKPKADCEGNQAKCTNTSCPLYGTLGKTGRDGKRRVKGCADPVARGKRNRAKGDAKALKARKALGIGGANTRHEELWGGAFRIEVKAGAQIQPIATRFDKAEAQSEQHRPIGDNRPFLMVAMPDGTSDGIVLGRLSQLGELLRILQEEGKL
jgi:hypothetical protein